MKKAIALALGLAAATSANAALEAGNGQTVGELFLSVWNSDTETSFTYDLGLSVENFNNGTATAFSVTIDAAAIDHIDDTVSIAWNIAGANSVTPFNLASVDTFGVYFSGNSAVTTAPTFNEIQSRPGTFNQYIDAQADNASANVGTAADPIYLVSGATTYAGGQLWGGSMGGLSGWAGLVNPSQHSVGETVLAQIVGQTVAGGMVFDTRTDATGWTFDIVDGAGVLTYGEVSAVPVPAAAWLFGSALVGLVGIGRRRNA